MASWLELPDERRRKQGVDADARDEVRRRSPADELMFSGERLYYAGEFLDAAREFRRARRHDPSLFDAWAAEVDARLRAGDLRYADEAATEALTNFGKVPIFYAAKALVLAHQGQIAAACEHSDIAVKLQPGSIFTWLARAEVLLATRESVALGGADTCFARAEQADPTHWRASFRAALALARWGRHDRALERLAQVTQLTPANPFVWKAMGDCHLALRDPVQARHHYQLALARRPGYRPALEALRSLTVWGRLWKGAVHLLKRMRVVRDA